MADTPIQTADSPQFETSSELVAWRLGQLEKTVSASTDIVTTLLRNPPWLTRQATIDLINLTVGDNDTKLRAIETSINDLKNAMKQRGNSMTYWVGIVVGPIVAAVVTYVMLGGHG